MARFQRFFIPRKFWPFVTIVLLGSGIYFNSLGAAFQFDDIDFIVENHYIRSPENLTGLLEKRTWLVRVVTFATFALNYALHGYNVTGYHLVNVLIHIGAGCGVFVFFRMILASPRLKGRPPPGGGLVIPWIAALIFIAHPLQTQAVTYLSQRFTSLATLFYLWTLVFYLRARDPGIPSRRRMIWAASAALLALAGLFSKEIFISLPGVIVAVEFFFYRGRSVKAILKDKRVWTAGLVIAAFVAVLPLTRGDDLTRTYRSGSHYGDEVGPHNYWVTQLKAHLVYARLVVWPAGLNLDHDFPVANSLREPGVLAGVLWLAVFFLLILFTFRREPLIAFGGVWYILTVFLEAGVIPIQHVFFEHRLYLPMAGIALIGAVLLTRLTPSGVTRIAVTIGVIGVLSGLTVARNRVWQTPVSLWEDITRKSPGKARAHMNLALAYSGEGRYEEALDALNRAIEIRPGYALLYSNRGLVYRELGRTREALEDFNRALLYDPGIDYGYNNRGLIHKALGNYDQALEDYTTAVEKNRFSEEALTNRSVIYRLKGDYARAREDLDQALALNPDYAEALNNRGIVYQQTGDYAGSVEDFSRAIQLNPGLKEAHNNLGVSYKMSGQTSQALEAFDRAIELDPEYAMAFNNRGAALKDLGRLDEARADFRRARRLDPANIQAAYNLAEFYESEGEYHEAVRLYSEILRQIPREGHIYLKRSIAAFHAGDLSEAHDDALRARNLGAELPPNYLEQFFDNFKSHERTHGAP